jgi:hypothetical protein
MSTRLKAFTATLIALAILLTQTVPAFACGGLVAPNGSIRLARATTFVAWHDGIEHYMTSFAYQGNVSNLGWIVPLPAVPLKIEEGGAWTLQRLGIETRPQLQTFAASAPVSESAQVLQKVKIEALNITVIKGSGQAILDWVQTNGFALDSDTRAHLLEYAMGSPIFMAAKFDTSEAQKRHQLQGDGTPILITMKTPHLWVPLEVLALDDQQVQADLYLLTDTPLNTNEAAIHLGQSAVGSEIPNAPGFKVAFQEPMNNTLYHDLSTDRNMSWVPRNGWITYLSLDAPASRVTYDLGVTSTGLMHLTYFGTSPMTAIDKVEAKAPLKSAPKLPQGSFPYFVVISGLLILLALAWLYRTAAKPRKATQPSEV